jgi:hypothetical protein
MNGNKHQPVPFRLRQENGLHGKVAARRGVNIALACVAEPCKNLIKDEVEARGRRFLAIRGRINSADVVAQVTRTFGQLDLFIDCSTEGKKKRGQALSSLESHTLEPNENIEVFANSILTRAALHALT